MQLIQLPVVVLTLVGLVLIAIGIIAPSFEGIALGLAAVSIAGVIAVLGQQRSSA